jgi:hypothetical protein
MRRILLIAAMLLPISSALATVTITANVDTSTHDHDGVKHKAVTISYSSDVDVRAFALDINVTPTMNIGDSILTGFKVGESKVPAQGGTLGYGIFPGRFRDFVNPSNPDPCFANPTNYNPSTPWAAPGAENTGLGWPRIVVELGTLYSGDGNKPALSGNLFTFDVNSETIAGGQLTVDTEDLRGGIVGSDGTALASNLPITVELNFPAACSVPNCVGLTRQACLALLAGTSPPQAYTDVNVPGTPVGNVVSTVPAAGADCTGTVQMTVNSYPIKYMTVANSLYVNWQNRGRPACWAYPRQCRGDADGKKLGTLWVSSNDLNLLKSALSKLETALKNIPNGICSDYDHKKLGTLWVSSNDLNILKSYLSKLETAMNPQWDPGPTDNGLCGDTPDPNYHYWCLPTGVTCPPGQTCAPAGTCPNTP